MLGIDVLALDLPIGQSLAVQDQLLAPLAVNLHQIVQLVIDQRKHPIASCWRGLAIEDVGQDPGDLHVLGQPFADYQEGEVHLVSYPAYLDVVLQQLYSCCFGQCLLMPA